MSSKKTKKSAAIKSGDVRPNRILVITVEATALLVSALGSFYERKKVDVYDPQDKNLRVVKNKHFKQAMITRLEEMEFVVETRQQKNYSCTDMIAGVCTKVRKRKNMETKLDQFEIELRVVETASDTIEKGYRIISELQRIDPTCNPEKPKWNAKVGDC
jgi:hypothetical protein